MNIYTKKLFVLIKGKQKILWQKIFIKITILFFLILFLNIFQAPIRNSFYVISSPITKTFWKTGKNISFFIESFVNIKGLQNENDDLKEENQNLLSQISLLEESLRENQTLKEILLDNEINNFKVVLGKVIGLDISNDFILINRGLDDGVLENMSVVSQKKVFYGKIFKVYKNFSQVMLISNKNSVVDVKIQNDNLNKSLIYGALKGNGNLSAYLDLVSFDADIEEGDILITSALEGISPKNLLVGKIIRKNKNDLKPFQTAVIQPFFDIKNIENLFVITDYKQEK